MIKINRFRKIFRRKHNRKQKREPNRNIEYSASITVEAALIIPIFLFLCIRLISLFELMNTYSQIQMSLFETNQKNVKELHKIELQNQWTVSKKVSDYLKEIEFNYKSIKNGKRGFSYINTTVLDENDCIDLVVAYQIKPLLENNFANTSFLSRCKMRVWTGYDVLKNVQEKNKKEIAYITETGTVYHTNRKCSHLNLTLKIISKKKSSYATNYNGVTYEACEMCGYLEMSKEIIITNYGTKYHTNKLCSGIKRTIIGIEIDKIRNRRKCSRCL